MDGAWRYVIIASFLIKENRNTPDSQKLLFDLFLLGLVGWNGRNHGVGYAPHAREHDSSVVGDDEFLHPFPLVTCPLLACIYGCMRW
jgi:hypothetical protein